MLNRLFSQMQPDLTRWLFGSTVLPFWYDFSRSECDFKHFDCLWQAKLDCLYL